MNVIAADHKTTFITLGECVANYKDEFVEMLRECGISASIQDDNKTLVDKYVENVPNNPELLVASAYMCAYYSTDISFDGEKGVNNDQVHSISRGICQYFHCDGEGSSNIGGLVGGLVSKGTEAAKKFYDQHQRKQTAGVDLLAQKEAAKQQMINAALEQQRMKQEAEIKAAEEKKRKNKTYLVVGIVVGTLVLATAVYLIVKSKKKK